MSKAGTCACVVLALLGASCAKMPKIKMPQVKMPKMFKDETAEQKVQKQLGQVVRAQDEAAYFKEVGRLMELSRSAGWDGRRLIGAVVGYYPQVQGEQQLAQYNRLLETIRVPRSAVVDVAATRLENGQEPQASQAMLRWSAPPDPRGRVDFSHFRAYLEARSSQPPAKLVRWMFERDASAALWEMMEVYGRAISSAERRQIVLSEHVVSEVLFRQERGLLEAGAFEPAAAEQLDRLSQSEHWWVRLYAAQVLSEHPKLRKDATVERLKTDPSALVQQTLGAGK